VHFISGYEEEINVVTGNVAARRSGSHGLQGRALLIAAVLFNERLPCFMSCSSWCMPHTGIVLRAQVAGNRREIDL